MSDHIYFDGQRYISAAEASERVDLTRDYVARLCRDGRVAGKRVGKNWYVEEESLQNFITQQNKVKIDRREQLAAERAQEYARAHAQVPVLATSPVVVHPPAGETATHERSPILVDHALRVHRQLKEKATVQGARALSYAPAALAQPVGMHEAVTRTIAHGTLHVPAHAISPVTEFIHKFVALTLAFTMTFGTYALVDPSYARFAASSFEDSYASISDVFRDATGGGIGSLTRRSRSAFTYVAENPKVALAQASGATLSFVPDTLRSIARSVNSGIDSFVYAIAFPNDITSAAVATRASGGEAVEVAPYARGAQRISTDQRSDGSQAAFDASGSVTIIERHIETQNVVSVAGGISEEYLNQRLATLESNLLSRVLGSPSAGYTTVNNNYSVIAQSNKIDKLRSVAIEDSTISGGTISGATITGGSVEATSLSGVVAVENGGTGTSTAPSYGQVLLGNSSGTYDLVATSSLGISSGGSVSLSGANTWTALQLFSAGASTTNFSNFGIAHFGGSATTTIDSAGNLSVVGTLGVSGNTTLANATSTNFAVTGTASTSALVASNSFTFKNVTGFLKATAGAVSTALIDLATDVTGILPVGNGGTGWGNITANTLLTGNGSGALATTTIGNGLSLSGGSLSTSFGTTTANTWTALQLFSANASTTQLSVFDKAYFGGTATTTIDSTGAITVTSTSKNTFPYASSTALSVSGNAYFPGSGIWNSSGGLGVGTTTPVNKLSVHLNSAYEDGIQVYNVGAGGGNYLLGSGGFLSSVSAGGFFVYDKAAAAPRLTIGSAGGVSLGAYSATDPGAGSLILPGNVGIGTTSPWKMLSVAGDIIGTNITATGTLAASGAVTFSNYSNGLLYANGSGALSTVSTSTWTFASSTLLADNNTFSGSNIFSSPLTLSSTSGTTTIASGQGFAIGGTQFVVQQGSGRIGIGTNAPTTGLDINVGTDISGDLTLSGGSALTITATGPINQTGTGQVTFAGNVDATNGLDVTNADFTVGGSKFFVAPSTGNTTIAGALGLAGAFTASSTLQATGAARFFSTLRADGAITAAAAGTGLSVLNDASIGGTLSLTGAGTFGSSLSVAGTLSAATTTLSGQLSLNNKKISGLATPSDDQDAANKVYVDSVASGLDLKDSVKAATTGNITLSGEQTVDGVALVAGDRVLVKSQTDKTKNGIYVVSSGAWSRASDADEDSEVGAGMFTFVQDGTLNASSGWVLTTSGTITLGTTLLDFSQFSGAGQIVAGNGMTKTGNTLDVVGTANRITANADSIDIASTYIGQTSITTVGTLVSGALGSGFGNIDIGNSTINAGAATFSSITGSAITGSGNLTVNGTGSFTGALTISGTLSAATTTFSGNVALGGKKITGLADPTSAQEAATKAYVDAIAQGLTVKASVRAATTTNITLSGEQTVDGVALVAGNRILVMGQSTASGNGIYAVAAGAWSRAADADENSEVVQGMFAFVEEGTENANTGWSLITANPITLDSTSLTFTQFSGSAEVTAGDGLTKTGNTLNIGGTAGRITVSADSIDIANTYSGQSSIVTVGSLTSGSIGSGFGAINIGSNAITAGTGLFNTSLATIGTLSIGGSATTSIVGNSATSTFSGGITLSSGNVNLSSSGNFLIDDALVLNATGLGSSVVASSLTSVGALNSGSITTGFGAINIGADTLDAGDATLANLTISGSATTSQIAASSLTSGRVPFLTTGGRFIDSSSLTFDSTLTRLTVTHASTTALTATSGYFSTASTSNLTVSGINSAVLVAGASGSVSAASSQTCTNQFIRSLSAAYVATCASVTSDDITDNTIVNADINSAAAIAYSKLNLSGSIVNADISNSAAIAYSKLNLSSSITGSDLNLTDITLADFTNDASYAKTTVANTWSVLQSFSAGASTTQLSVFDKAYFGGAATTTISSDGTISVPGIASGYQIGGANALYASTTNNSVVVGPNSGASVFTAASATHNVVIGSASVTGASVSGDRNNVLGASALVALTSGSKNQAIGVGALTSLTEGWDNVVIGDDAGYYNATGNANVYIGQSSGRGTSGQNQSSNVAVGYRSLYTVSTGGSNTVLGNQAGYSITSGSNNVIIGNSGTSGSITSGSNNILIGQDVRDGLSVTSSNQLNIGNLLFGTGLGSGATAATGNVGVGTSTPWAKLAVQGTAGQTNPVFEVASSSNATPFLTVTSSGDIGLGTSSPSTKLEVVNTSSGSTIDQVYLTNFASATSTASRLTFRAADVTGAATSTGAVTAILRQNFGGGLGDLTFSTLQSGVLAEVMRATSAGYIGIGTTTPYRKLSVTDTVSNPQFALAYDATRDAQLRVDSTGDLHIAGSGGDAYLNNDNLWVCTGGSILTGGCPSGTPTGAGNLIVENKLGIGTTTPAYKLTIETQDDSTNFFQVASSSSQSLFVVNANGRIGVGTSSPWAKFTVGAGGAITTVENTLTDGTTVAVNWRDGNQQKVVLGGNRTVTFSNYVAGQILRLVVCQDGTGSRTITWPSAVRWQGGTAPTLTTTADQCDLVSFVATNATSSLVLLGAAALAF